jgi:signal transduction histidine kinase
LLICARSSYSKEMFPATNAKEANGSPETLALVGTITAELLHELRNSLQVITALAFAKRQESEAWQATARHADRMQVLVESTLAFVRGEPLAKEPMQLSEVLEEVAAELPVQLVIDPPRTEVVAHRILFGQLLATMIRNAIEAHASTPVGTRDQERERIPEQARLWVSTSVHATHVKILLQDNGRGVPEEIADRLFEPRATTKTTGTGLGLSFAKRVALAHGGLIRLAREEERGRQSQGACFVIELPLA